jgi:hypothetical protein
MCSSGAFDGFLKDAFDGILQQPALCWLIVFPVHFQTAVMVIGMISPYGPLICSAPTFGALFELDYSYKL